MGNMVLSSKIWVGDYLGVGIILGGFGGCGMLRVLWDWVVPCGAGCLFVLGLDWWLCLRFSKVSGCLGAKTSRFTPKPTSLGAKASGYF